MKHTILNATKLAAATLLAAGTLAGCSDDDNPCEGLTGDALAACFDTITCDPGLVPIVNTETGASECIDPTATTCTLATAAADCGGYACVIADGATEGTCSATECTDGYALDTSGATAYCAPITAGGCDDGCGAYACDDANDTCFTPCTDGSACADTAQCDDVGGTMTCVETSTAYMYVAVVSRASGEDALDNPNPGPDLEFISVSSGGNVTAATTVVSSNQGVEGSETNTRPLSTNADAVKAEDTVSGGVCDLDAQPGYVAIGGDGGYIVVGFGREIATGDTITVVEIDSNNCADATTERPDAYDVYITEDANLAANPGDFSAWCLVGSQGGNGGTFSQAFDASSCAM